MRKPNIMIGTAMEMATAVSLTRIRTATVIGTATETMIEIGTETVGETAMMTVTATAGTAITIPIAGTTAAAITEAPASSDTRTA